jgi:hypothetical protein
MDLVGYTALSNGLGPKATARLLAGLFTNIDRAVLGVTQVGLLLMHAIMTQRKTFLHSISYLIWMYPSAQILSSGKRRRLETAGVPSSGSRTTRGPMQILLFASLAQFLLPSVESQFGMG